MERDLHFPGLQPSGATQLYGKGGPAGFRCHLFNILRFTPKPSHCND